MQNLAINGGPKAVKSLGPSQPKVGIEEILELLDLWHISPEAKRKIEETLQVEKGNKAPHLFRYYGTTPSKVRQLEEEFARLMDVPYALGVNSCTSALIAALVACGVGPGCEVIVPGYTFFASAAAVVVAKAIPVIAEVDDSLTLDPNDFENKITDRTKAVVPVHMRGMCCDMDAIMEIANKYNLKVIEDVAQACGGSFKGKRLGTFGDAGCFSLDFYKIITSGEGGLIITRDEWIYIRAQSYHDTAACWRPDRFGRERMPGELFAGENYRMSELQGAVALAQLRRLDALLTKMRSNKNRIKAGIHKINGLEFRKAPDAEGDTAICLVMYLPDVETTKKAIKAMQAEGVPAGGIYDATVRDWHIYSNWEHILEKKTATNDGCPYSCPYYEGSLPTYSVDMCPHTLDLLSRSVHIDISPDYTPQECDAIVEGINKVVQAYLGSPSTKN